MFAKHTIETEFAKHSFDFDNKAGKGKIKDIEIPIPINSAGDIDMSAQQEIAEKYQKIEHIKKDISEKLDKIANVVVELV